VHIQTAALPIPGLKQARIIGINYFFSLIQKILRRKSLLYPKISNTYLCYLTTTAFDLRIGTEIFDPIVVVTNSLLQSPVPIGMIDDCMTHGWCVAGSLEGLQCIAALCGRLLPCTQQKIAPISWCWVLSGALVCYYEFHWHCICDRILEFCAHFTKIFNYQLTSSIVQIYVHINDFNSFSID